jgi:hypothetical protein
VTAAMAAHAGVVLRERGEGDSTFSVFSRASDAAAAYSAQSGLEAEAWPPSARLSVRLAVHSGESVERDGDFLGPAVNRAARLRAVARGGEVLLSESTAMTSARARTSACGHVLLDRNPGRSFEAGWIVGATDGHQPRPATVIDRRDERLEQLACRVEDGPERRVDERPARRARDGQP